MAFISFTSTNSNIVGTTLTIGGSVAGTVVVGQTLSGVGITPGTIIISGSGLVWTVNNTQTVGLEEIDGALYYASILDLPPQLWRDDYTWIQQGMLSPNVLSLGKDKYDWPLPTPDYRETGQRSWEWSYNWKLLGKDVLPAGGRRSYDLPILPDQRETRREVRSWEWRYNLNLIGKDKLPAGGRRHFDLPILPDQRETRHEVRSWEWKYNQNLIGKDTLPFRQQDWPVPRSYEYHIQFRTWTWSYNLNLIGKDTLPLRQQDWPTPTAVRQGVQWMGASIIALTSGQQAPFKQTDWTLPQASYRDDATWLSQGIITVTAQTLPFNQYNWPISQGYSYPSDLRTWINPLLPLLQVTYVFRNPYFAYETQPPRIDTWSQPPNLTLLTAVVPKPFTQTDWANPQPQPLMGETWLSQGYLTIPATTPFAQYDWPTPQRPVSVDTWLQNVNLALLTGQAPKPFAQYDWPLPQQAPTVQAWIQAVNIALLAQQPKPFVQNDWPLPIGPAYQNDLRTWAASYNRNLIGKDKLPIRQQDWPNPRDFIRHPDWIWPTNLALYTTAARTNPFNQFDWPLPTPPYRDEQTWINQGYLPFQQRTIPFNQFDWPLPGGHAVATLGTRIDTVPPYITPVPPPVTVGIFTVSGPTTEDLFSPVSGVNYTWSPTQQRTA